VWKRIDAEGNKQEKVRGEGARGASGEAARSISSLAVTAPMEWSRCKPAGRSDASLIARARDEQMPRLTGV
jgi:hypothetical protein